MAKLFLGFDASTQSLSVVVIDYERRQVVYERSLNFDEALPQYGTRNGVLPNADPLVRHSPPLMWAEALDALFDRMSGDGVPLREVLAVSGGGQQHGSVYLNDRATEALARLDAAGSLVDGLGEIFSRETSPIWMDSSASAECKEIRDALGGIEATARETGSDTFERFTGPQIRKFHKTEPENYAGTANIALVSSFMASLLTGRIAPIDHGDGAGMNLMDIREKRWHPRALEITAPELREKLPPLVEPWTCIGQISPYFVKKYAVNPGAKVVVWSGDNPCSVVGLGLIKEGAAAISLGTSDTYFGAMSECRTDARGTGHVFGSPTGDYLSLICFKNGSLARERIRDEYRLDWSGFNEALAQRPPGNRGGILLPWFEPEIVPRVQRPGVRRFDLDPADVGGHCRAVVEAQMMSIRLHSQWMNVVPHRIFATGGASINAAILQVMADVMNCPVLRIELSNSAALGAALRAAHGWFVQAGDERSWEEIIEGFTAPVPGSEIEPKAARIYDELIEKYAWCERDALNSE